MKENFYHGVLLGLLSHREDWAVYSNRESGDGKLGIVIEVKYPDGGDLEKGCRQALEQIDKMGYEEKLRQDDYEKVLKYGIACNRKKCKEAVSSVEKRAAQEKSMQTKAKRAKTAEN